MRHTVPLVSKSFPRKLPPNGEPTMAKRTSIILKLLLAASFVTVATLGVVATGTPSTVDASGGDDCDDSDMCGPQFSKAQKKLNKAFKNYLKEVKNTQKLFTKSETYLLDDAHTVGAYDLIVYDRCRPKQMPQANTFFIGTLPPAGGWEAEPAGGEMHDRKHTDVVHRRGDQRGDNDGGVGHLEEFRHQELCRRLGYRLRGRFYGRWSDYHPGADFLQTLNDDRFSAIESGLDDDHVRGLVAQ